MLKGLFAGVGRAVGVSGFWVELREGFDVVSGNQARRHAVQNHDHREELIREIVRDALLFSDDPRESLEQGLAHRSKGSGWFEDGHLRDLEGDPITADDVAAYLDDLDQGELAELTAFGMAHRAKESVASTERETAQAATEANRAETDKWDALSEAVGGDLFADERKLAAMRKIDKAMGSGASWEAFSAAVVAEVKQLPVKEAETAATLG